MDHRDAASGVIVDGHSDFLIDVLDRHRRGEIDPLQRRHVPRFRDGQVGVAFAAVAGDGAIQSSDYAAAIRDLDIIHDAVRMASNSVMILESAEDLSTAISEGKIGLLLGFEGASPLEGDPGALETFYERGVRWLGLTWNRRNAFADGLAEEDDRGLTDAGRSLIRRTEALNVLVDISHASSRTVDDVLSLTTRPVIASHSNPRSICAHQRNLTDRQIDGIAQHGGTIGVCFFPAMVSRDTAPTLADVVRHIRYLEQRAGIGHVAIGADFIDYAEHLFSAGLAVSGVDYGANLQYPEGLRSTEDLPALRDSLIRDGLAEQDAHRVMGGNLLDLLENCL